MTLEVKIVSGILRREGWPKYTNDPADRGGPTKGGITLKAWREHINDPGATARDVQAITESQARSFYRRKYIIKPKFELIACPYLRELVVDAGVHHGPRAATKWLQRSVGTRQDGIIGDITIEFVNSADPRELYLRVISFRIRLFGRLIGRDPELAKARRAGFNLQARWAGGWNNRAAKFIDSMADRIEARHTEKVN